MVAAGCPRTRCDLPWPSGLAICGADIHEDESNSRRQTDRRGVDSCRLSDRTLGVAERNVSARIGNAAGYEQGGAVGNVAHVSCIGLLNGDTGRLVGIDLRNTDSAGVAYRLIAVDDHSVFKHDRTCTVAPNTGEPTRSYNPLTIAIHIESRDAHLSRTDWLSRVVGAQISTPLSNQFGGNGRSVWLEKGNIHVLAVGCRRA